MPWSNTAARGGANWSSGRATSRSCGRTGHRRLAASADLLVVGAYPGASDSSHVRPSELDHAQAIAEIASVKLPKKDPVYGKDGPLMKAWRPDRLQ